MSCSVRMARIGKERPAASSAGEGGFAQRRAGCATDLRGRARRTVPHAQTFSTSGRAEQAGRHEDQRHGEDREGGDVLVVDREVGRPQRLDQADEQAAEHGARQRADAAEHGGGEGLDAGHEAVGEVHDAVVEHVEHAGDGGERAADDEGDRDRAVDVDAEQRRHRAVLLAGALGAAERRLLHDVPEDGEQHRRHHHDEDLLVGDRDGVAMPRWPTRCDHVVRASAAPACCAGPARPARSSSGRSTCRSPRSAAPGGTSRAAADRRGARSPSSTAT